MVDRPGPSGGPPFEFDAKLPEVTSSGLEQSHRVVAIRTTGIVPESVAEKMEQELCVKFSQGWQLERIVPVIYNSSTTGYFLLIFASGDS